MLFARSREYSDQFLRPEDSPAGRTAVRWIKGLQCPELIIYNPFEPEDALAACMRHQGIFLAGVVELADTRDLKSLGT